MSLFRVLQGDAQIFTKDALNLAERFSRDVSKTSALEAAKLQVSVPSLIPESTETKPYPQLSLDVTQPGLPSRLI
jgi:hypothetical protein